ncbi:MAG: ATP phosphoribosyltransferase regulatory subunit [Candidatus Pacearchaeota archaeon]|nr:ATP phosphoribosyltransferase regulatory subunit [Candidatus Pacearchaeota archaeon]
MQLVKGFCDFFGEKAIRREKIKEIIKEKFKTYGFEPAETPVIEYEEFAKKDQAEETISDIFRLEDKGKRKLALRYEFTFQLKRLAKGKKLPYRRYQIGYVFRDEPTGKNRLRQFTQCDIDIVGSSIRDEAEILKVFSEILQELKIKSYVKVNNRKLLNEILNKEGIKGENISKVIREIDKLEKIPLEEIKKNLEKLGAEKILKIIKKPKTFFKKYDSFEEVEELLNYCKIFNVKAKFFPSMARGLAYYTGNIFEIQAKGVKESIAGGGTYLIDGIQSTGISFGLERLEPLAKINIENIKCIVISVGKEKEAINIMQKLRKEKISCFMMDKLTKALEYANTKKIPYVLFIGTEEVKKNKVKMRDMNTGKETFFTLEELIKILKS